MDSYRRVDRASPHVSHAPEIDRMNLDETANRPEAYETPPGVTLGRCPRSGPDTLPIEPATAGSWREPGILWPSRPARQHDTADHRVAPRSLSRADKQTAHRAIPTPEWPSVPERESPEPRARVRYAQCIRAGTALAVEHAGAVRRPRDVHFVLEPAPQRGGDNERRAARRFLQQNEPPAPTPMCAPQPRSLTPASRRSEHANGPFDEAECDRTKSRDTDRARTRSVRKLSHPANLCCHMGSRKRPASPRRRTPLPPLRPF